MKKIINVLIVSMLLCGTSATFIGCGTPAAKTTQVAGSVTISVDAAMKSWGSWVRNDRATLEQRIQVRDAYNKYKAAMKLAEDIAIVAINSPADQPRYQVAIQLVAASANDVINLIQLFTTPVKH